MPKVSIYTTPTCTYCRMAKAFFQEKGVNYEEYNVATDLARREEMFTKSQQKGVPVITITKDDGQEELIVGFDKDRLAQVLGV